jgi:hypothetical protein
VGGGLRLLLRVFAKAAIKIASGAATILRILCDDICAVRALIGRGRAVNARPYGGCVVVTFDAKAQFILIIKKMKRFGRFIFDCSLTD